MNKLVYLVLSLFWSHALSQNACTTPLGQRSNCVSLYECPQLVVAFEQRPLPSHVVSFLQKSQCGFAASVPKVCCGRLPQNDNVQTTPAPVQNKPVLVNLGLGQVDPVNTEDSSPSPRNECGFDTTGDKIFGGQFTELGEHPWLGLMGYLTSSGSMTYQCGSALLNRRYLLTAAHCIMGEIEIKVGKLTSVRLGEYDTRTAVDCVDNVCADPHQEIAVQVAVPHPGYKDKNKNTYDDIGIVRLAKRVTYNYYVQPICLVSSSERLAVGSEAYVAGWGKTLNGTNSQLKLKLELPVFDQKECGTIYQKVGVTVSTKQLCAGGVFAKDSCKGDSGGPLMRKRPQGVWDVVGVVSFGNGCGRDGWPGIYTSVASYIDWIQDTITSTNV